MSVLVILGSRNPAGQTARAAEALCSGLAQANCPSERVFLPQLKLEQCRQCEDNGWGECLALGSCVIQDGFSALVGRIRASKLVVFANPVYFGQLSESMRGFLDRLRRCCRNAQGKAGIEGKKAAGICVAGGGGGGAASCCLSLEQVLATCGFDVLDLVPVRRQNLEMKLELLRLTGLWLAGQTVGAQA
jgi:multimeric flavodoxin WrbA